MVRMTGGSDYALSIFQEGKLVHGKINSMPEGYEYLQVLVKSPPFRTPR